MESKELKQLAMDIVEGRVFTDRHVRPADKELISSIFMPLAFLEKETAAEMLKVGPGLIYEDLNEAGPRSLNGYPIFMSFKYLSIDDTAKVFEYYELIKKQKEAFLEDVPSTPSTPS